jgi:hypothetical protein
MLSLLKSFEVAFEVLFGSLKGGFRGTLVLCFQLI